MYASWRSNMKYLKQQQMVQSNCCTGVSLNAPKSMSRWECGPFWRLQLVRRNLVPHHVIGWCPNIKKTIGAIGIQLLKKMHYPRRCHLKFVLIIDFFKVFNQLLFFNVNIKLMNYLKMILWYNKYKVIKWELPFLSDGHISASVLQYKCISTCLHQREL